MKFRSTFIPAGSELTHTDTLILEHLDFDPIKFCWNPAHDVAVEATWIASSCTMALNLCAACKLDAGQRAGRGVRCRYCLTPALNCWRFHPIGGTE